MNFPNIKQGKRGGDEEYETREDIKANRKGSERDIQLSTN